MLDESGKIVTDLKKVTDLMNKNFVYITDKLLNERKDAFHNNREFVLVQYVMVLNVLKLRCTLGI